MASEPSPNAGVTLAMRSQAVIDLINEVAAPDDSVFLMGHSLGGITVTDVAERLGDRLTAVIYLTAFMLPPGMPTIAMIQHEKMTGEEVAPLFLSDPTKTGALRLDPDSDDAGYRERVISAFYGDLIDTDAADALHGLHSDEPALVVLDPSPMSKARFGQHPVTTFAAPGIELP
ncbi:MAG: alpha/beta fold hydrolase [Natronospirillum sp.]